MVAKIIYPSGVIQETEPANGKAFTLEELRSFVGGGYIEILRPFSFHGAVLVADVDGKAKGLPINYPASSVFLGGTDFRLTKEKDFVVGTVLLCHQSQIL